MTINNKVLNLFLDSNQKTTEALMGIRSALEKINDQNNLHQRQLQHTNDNTAELLGQIKAISKNTRWVIYLIFLLVGSLIVLAGAEKVFSLWPLPHL